MTFGDLLLRIQLRHVANQSSLVPSLPGLETQKSLNFSASVLIVVSAQPSDNAHPPQSLGKDQDSGSRVALFFGDT